MPWNASASEIDRIWNWTFPRALAMRWAGIIDGFSTGMTDLGKPGAYAPGAAPDPGDHPAFKTFIEDHDRLGEEALAHRQAVATATTNRQPPPDPPTPQIATIASRLPDAWSHRPLWGSLHGRPHPDIPLIVDDREKTQNPLRFDFVLSNLGILLPQPEQPAAVGGKTEESVKRDVLFEYLLTSDSSITSGLPGFRVGGRTGEKPLTEFIGAPGTTKPQDLVEIIRDYLDNGKSRVKWLLRGTHFYAILEALPRVIAQYWILLEGRTSTGATPAEKEKDELFLEVLAKRIHGDMPLTWVKIRDKTLHPHLPADEVVVDDDGLHIPRPEPPADLQSLYVTWALGESRIPTFSTQGSPCTP